MQDEYATSSDHSSRFIHHGEIIHPIIGNESWFIVINIFKITLSYMGSYTSDVTL